MRGGDEGWASSEAVGGLADAVDCFGSYLVVLEQKEAFEALLAEEKRLQPGPATSRPDAVGAQGRQRRDPTRGWGSAQPFDGDDDERVN